MKIYTEEGAAIKGNIITAEARKIGKPTVIANSNRHKTNRIVLKDNVICVINKKLKYLK
ncbi:hypothetical protein [Methanobrevibacter sp. DSM 116169]|uniref:hypothetical protein n=1 Tax=Methanobrevibacter sp. DSM 116169 TaxID=3242727 RepID=UPI0038FBF530